MGSLPLHPALVHIPLGLAFVAPLLAMGVLFLFWKDRLPRKAWALVVGCQALLVAGGFVAMRTGSAEEDTVERVGVSEQAIHQHEEAAEVFAWTAAAVLALAAIVLVLPAGTSRTGAVAAIVGMLVVAGLGVRVGHAGGQLVYQHNAGAAYSDGAVAAAVGSEGKEKHER